jgi:hypothetical protein
MRDVEGLIWRRIRILADCCAFGNESSVYVKFGKFLDEMISFSTRISCRGRISFLK